MDASGNVLTTGHFHDWADFGGSFLSSAGSSDIFVAKYDANGAHQWSQRFGGPAGDLPTGIAVDDSGNVLITGYFYDWADFGGGPLVSAGLGDVFVAKYDANGAHQWSQRLGGTGDDVGSRVAVDTRGNLILTGSFRGTADFGGGDLVSAGSRDIYLAGYDANGAHQWSRRFGGVGEDVGSGLATDAVGNVVVTGYFNDTVDFGGGDLASAGARDIYIAKYDDNGVHQWSRSFGAPSSDEGSGIAADAAGNVVVTGYFSDRVDLGGGDLITAGGADIFVAQYSDRTTVHIDIEPGSCPNPLNITDPGGENANGGVLPVAVLGSEEFDVHDIDVSSLTLAGGTPLRSSYVDVAAPPGDEDDCACAGARPDGFTDLMLGFRRLDVVAGLGSVFGDSMPVTLTGHLMDGTPIEGTDCVRIVPSKRDGGPR